MQKLNVTKIVKREEQYIVSVDEELMNEQADSLRAGERMLVDSDGLAFVYILEDDKAFYYLSFPKETWNVLYQAYKEKSDLKLVLNKKVTLPLTNIHEELDFLLENIEGNGNYGEVMEEAVREVFQ
ncbi:hypothetical protein [Halalkalibacter urbisdiaboli]|uniref:UPF0738 family protein n=1 Tax=Halalkalibacter urbisdiaboli TaxID=1960589 RepID=UPI000B44DF9B|nr:hypothetical protein [Halalkalibacter urbisdiaboli]